MASIIISDTALIDTNYQTSLEDIKMLKSLQEAGVKIVMLSNRPELCMRKIGIFVDVKNGKKVKYRYIGACDTKENGVDYIFYTEKMALQEHNIKADYTIFGNGICIFDEKDNLIYEGKFISRDTLEKMITIFRDNGYVSYQEYTNMLRDGFGDYCFKNGENVYKFFTPKLGSANMTKNTYGMQCGHKTDLEDLDIIKKMEEIPEIIGYILNDKPCFYQRNVNKLVALEYLFANHLIDLEHANIILSEPTDDIIAKKMGAKNQNESGGYFKANTALKKILYK